MIALQKTRKQQQQQQQSKDNILVLSELKHFPSKVVYILYSFKDHLKSKFKIKKKINEHIRVFFAKGNHFSLCMPSASCLHILWHLLLPLSVFLPPLSLLILYTHTKELHIELYTYTDLYVHICPYTETPPKTHTQGPQRSICAQSQLCPLWYFTHRDLLKIIFWGKLAPGLPEDTSTGIHQASLVYDFFLIEV